MNAYKKWLLNAPLKKKFQPVQTILFSLVVSIGIISMVGLRTVNNISQEVLSENVENEQKLYEIIRTMYSCRVLGRDILLSDNHDDQLRLFDQYLLAFYNLDLMMENYSKRLTDEKKETFDAIIEEKNIYKDSMLLSANIEMRGGDFFDALEALTRVTPIANTFFGSIDSFLQEEKLFMEDVLEHNNQIVRFVTVFMAVSFAAVAMAVLVLIRSFASTMQGSLGSLEKSVSKIAQTGNMKTDIPEHLFTKDEIGKIAIVIDKLKTMLLNYSFKDSLTGGFNATAYHEELWDMFRSRERSHEQKDFWCMICDMNNLKKVNDILGHNAGNEALIQSYTALLHSFSEFGKIYRVGGDEFVIILTDCTESQIEDGLVAMQERVADVSKEMNPSFSLAWGYGKFEGTSREEFDAFFAIIDKKMYEKKAELKKLL